MALDHGSRRIGVAVSDPLGLTAQPYDTFEATDPEVLNRIAQTADDLGVTEIVVGLPVSLDGSEGPAAVAARVFADEVRAATRLPVTLHDERFSSVTAERVLLEGDVRRAKRKDVRDRVAAAVFLQSYLDGRP